MGGVFLKLREQGDYMAIVHTVTYLSFVKIFLFFLLVLSVASTIKSIITGDMKSDHYFDWYFIHSKLVVSIWLCIIMVATFLDIIIFRTILFLSIIVNFAEMFYRFLLNFRTDPPMDLSYLRRRKIMELVFVLLFILSFVF